MNLFIDRPLRGLGENSVLMAKGDVLNQSQLEKSVAAARAAKTLLIVIAMDQVAHSLALAYQEFERYKLIVLGRLQLEAILNCSHPQDAFLEFVRDQISFLALVPFETSVPAFGPYFTGRAFELRKLQSHQDFAIFGPGGMGKSSLLRQWMWLRRLHDLEAYERTIDIDLQGTSEPDDACRKIISCIEKKVSARSGLSDGVTLRTFSDAVECLHKEYSRRPDVGGPFYLILDEVGGLLEVDRHRENADYFQNANSTGRDHTKFPLLHVTRSLVSRGFLRLTLCAREETRDLLSNRDNPFCVDGGLSRLKPLEILPLSDSEARKMLIQPLTDLGIDITAHRDRLDEALMAAKGIPFRIADFGLDIALEADTNVYSRRASVGSES